MSPWVTPILIPTMHTTSTPTPLPGRLAGPTATGMNMRHCGTGTRISPTSTTGTRTDCQVAPDNIHHLYRLTRSFICLLIYQKVK